MIRQSEISQNFDSHLKNKTCLSKRINIRQYTAFDYFLHIYLRHMSNFFRRLLFLLSPSSQASVHNRKHVGHTVNGLQIYRKI